MKKGLITLTTILYSIATCLAGIISVDDARKVAVNYYTHSFNKAVSTANVIYTGYTSKEEVAYYIFNINDGNGFIIVSAEDAAEPILGGSDKGYYDWNNMPSNVAFWMQHYIKQISAIRRLGLSATADIASQWQENLTGTYLQSNRKMVVTSVNPLLTTTWDQTQYYDALCPGGSITGCVATAMSQIMKYWSYPPHGIGTSYYTEETPYDNENYGVLSANYRITDYDWSAMPAKVTSNNPAVASIMYQSGVSVDMDYSPSISGSFVTTIDNPVCAQTSLITYFGYDPNTIQGLEQSNYSVSAWSALLENELNNNRVILYAGTGIQGGHAWVLDGYNNSGLFHMNWGWSGGYDNYYNLDNLNPGGTPLDSDEEAVIGIEPPSTFPSFTAYPLSGCKGMSVTFTDHSMYYGNDSITTWQWTFPGGNPATSTKRNPTVTYSKEGAYNVTETAKSSSGSNTVTVNGYITVLDDTNLPLKQGFETGLFPPSHWSINNPNNYPATWQIAEKGGYGKSTHSMYFPNCDQVTSIRGQRSQIYSPIYTFPMHYNPILAMWFDVAYAPVSSSQSDTLAIYYSLDCGQTFSLIYLKGGMTLATADSVKSNKDNLDALGCFSPSDAQWRTDTLYLPQAINGQSSVLFSFENRSGDGSNLYIDNVNIPAKPLSVEEITSLNSINVFPNPSKGIFNFQLYEESDKWSVEVYNVLGKKIYSQYSILYPQYSVDLNNQPAGIYFYRILDLSGLMISSGKLSLL